MIVIILLIILVPIFLAMCGWFILACIAAGVGIVRGFKEAYHAGFRRSRLKPRCPTCKGKGLHGHVSGNFVKCETCHGTGRL